MNPRQILLQQLATKLLGTPTTFILRVAVDGVDGAGKTHFADELAERLRISKRDIIRASVDGFHNPPDVRHRLGRASPEGFYQHSYNYNALKENLLDPMKPGGSGRYRPAVYDVALEKPTTVPLRQANAGAILLLDGIFLHRPELRTCWDVSVWLEVPFSVSVGRMSRRDGGSPDPDAKSNHRYVEGQRIYRLEAHPERHATFVVNNEDLRAPYFVPRF